ncbi:RNA polymerase sigma factor [Virgisporangium aurantiacum]|uniref:RNA polymerase sigma factor SigS n=1 Tax=Virgisporangium aurantiacum TaxID=175570 RepID=A0A8J4E3F9_9ACTN|nr:sigma-70 family RNA polymerase sigma factor [Virgisporangium aurantiacum]GIJ60056.1 hypothetical protein Vau01_075720 [Virgisporangium aurantiacum]
MTTNSDPDDQPSTVQTPAGVTGADLHKPSASDVAAVDAVADQVARNAEFALFCQDDMPRLVAFVMSLGAPAALAADIAQDSMTTTYRRWDSVDNPRAWVRTVAKRTWWKLADQSRTEIPRQDLPPSSGLLTDAQADEITHQHTFLALLQPLTPHQREIMAWTYDGYQPTEIAAIMVMNPATVRSALRDARAKLAPMYRAQDTP